MSEAKTPQGRITQLWVGNAQPRESPLGYLDNTLDGLLFLDEEEHLKVELESVVDLGEIVVAERNGIRFLASDVFQRIFEQLIPPLPRVTF